MREIAKYLELA